MPPLRPRKQQPLRRVALCRPSHPFPPPPTRPQDKTSPRRVCAGSLAYPPRLVLFSSTPGTVAVLALWMPRFCCGFSPGNSPVALPSPFSSTHLLLTLVLYPFIWQSGARDGLLASPRFCCGLCPGNSPLVVPVFSLVSSACPGSALISLCHVSSSSYELLTCGGRLSAGSENRFTTSSSSIHSIHSPIPSFPLPHPHTWHRPTPNHLFPNFKHG